MAETIATPEDSCHVVRQCASVHREWILSSVAVVIVVAGGLYAVGAFETNEPPEPQASFAVETTPQEDGPLRVDITAERGITDDAQDLVLFQLPPAAADDVPLGREIQRATLERQAGSVGRKWLSVSTLDWGSTVSTGLTATLADVQPGTVVMVVRQASDGSTVTVIAKHRIEGQAAATTEMPENQASITPASRSSSRRAAMSSSASTPRL